MFMNSLSSNPPIRRETLFLLLLIAIASIISGCSRPTAIEKIKQERVLHVITRNAPTTYFEDRDGATGFEYELAKLFAEDLGVELRLRVASNLGEIYQVIDQNYSHFAATGMGISPELSQRFPTSPAYLEITPKVLYRIGTKRPRSVQDLIGRDLLVMANSSHAETLRRLQQDTPELTWQETTEHEVVDLLKMLEDGEIDLTIVDSNEYAVNQAYFPRIGAGFDLTASQPVAWIFPATEDDSLRQRAEEFFQRIEQDGTLMQLKERFYGHVNQLNYVGARTFIRHIEQRLPRYEATFKEAAARYGLDWRLLAAIGYQESHWRPNAVSPTGVRGLMMLTQATARDLGIRNRLDPTASIMGGARYFAQIHRRIPEQIQEPDRTWMALASYNVGLGHLEDARIITQRLGFNPNAWMDVKEHLPLLQNAKWYRQTKHGYARGMEPVRYVQNIRRYYDVLAWVTQPDEPTHIALEEDPQPSQASAQLRLPTPFLLTPPML